MSKKSQKITKDDLLQVFILGNVDFCLNILNAINNDDLTNKTYKIVAICLNNEWKETGSYNSTPAISLRQLIQKIKAINNYIIIFDQTMNNFKETYNFLKNNGIHNYILPTLLNGHFRYPREVLTSIQNFNISNEALVVTSPPKTGNMSLCKTLNDNDIDFMALEHNPDKIDFFQF